VEGDALDRAGQDLGGLGCGVIQVYRLCSGLRPSWAHRTPDEE
jgi:hypothetical protein